MRYFLWNFAGRQNDIANMDGNTIHGNWESGLNFEKYRDAPPYLRDNKAKSLLFSSSNTRNYWHVFPF